jgi:hypothetical protein
MIEIGSIRFRLAVQYATAGGYWIARSSRAMTAQRLGQPVEKCAKLQMGETPRTRDDEGNVEKVARRSKTRKDDIHVDAAR